MKYGMKGFKFYSNGFIVHIHRYCMVNDNAC